MQTLEFDEGWRPRRPRRPVVRRLVLAGAALFIAAVVLVLLGGGRRAPRPAPALATAGPPALTLPRARSAHGGRSSSRVRGERADRRAVARVLRFTPLVVSGRPRRSRRVVALTFDDGPSPYTPAVVGILARMRVPATFFVVGQQLRYFAAGLNDELRHGFTVGDHTLNHAWLVRLGRSGQLDQIAGDARLLARAGVPALGLFRPPYGAYDGVTLRLAHRLRMLTVLWSVDPGDWRRPGTRAIVAGVLGAVRPGAIVLLHDGGGDRTQTIAALPVIVRGLRRRGYRLVTVPTLLAIDPPPRHARLPRELAQ